MPQHTTSALAVVPPPVHSTSVAFNIADGVPEHLVHAPGSDHHDSGEHDLDERGPDEHGAHGEHGLHVHREREVVRLPNEALARRVQRLRTDAGREVSLRLPSGSSALRPGDVLAVTDTSFVVVETTTTRVITVRPANMHEMGVAAHALGNRHRQVQFFTAADTLGRDLGVTGDAAVFCTPYDHTVTDHLDSLGVRYTVDDVELTEPFRHAEHQH